MNADEKALVTFVDAHNDEALTLLERVVNINSGTQNHAGVQEVGKVFRQELDAPRIQDTLGGRRTVQARRAPDRRACRAVDRRSS